MTITVFRYNEWQWKLSWWMLVSSSSFSYNVVLLENTHQFMGELWAENTTKKANFGLEVQQRFCDSFRGERKPENTTADELKVSPVSLKPIYTRPPLSATFFGGHSIHWLLFKPLYKGHLFLSQRWPFWRGSTVYCTPVKGYCGWTVTQQFKGRCSRYFTNRLAHTIILWWHVSFNVIYMHFTSILLSDGNWAWGAL